MKSLIPSFLIFAAIVAFVIADQALDLGFTLFLLKKFSDLIEFVSIWR